MPRQDSNANVQGPAEAGLPLVLTAADFDAPDAAGESYLFERLLGWGAGMRVRLRSKRVPVDISAPSAAEGARRLFFSRALSRRSESSASLAAVAREAAAA